MKSVRYHTVSGFTALALILGSGLAFAADAPRYGEPTLGQRVEAGAAATKDAVVNAANKTGEAVSAIAKKVGDSISDLVNDADKDGHYTNRDLKGYSRATDLLGEDVYGLKKDHVADVADVLVDAKGDISKVVLSNGGLMGIGDKLVVVDYAHLYQTKDSQTLLVPLTEEIIKGMRPFSYDVKDQREGMVVMPSDLVSVKELLDGNFVNAANETLTGVDEVTFKNGKADYIVGDYKSSLLGASHPFGVPYDQVTKVDADGRVDVRLNDVLNRRLVNFMEHVKNTP